MSYQPHLHDICFILHDVLKAPAQLQALEPHADCDIELMRQVLDEAGKFVTQEVAPLQGVGDAIGCKFVDGSVIAPLGFKDAYQAFWQAGWPALACAPEDGGQGLPALLEAVLYEMLSAANHGWTMAPGLLHGAYECLKHHGSDELKARYLSKIATGEWLATMCLTEPHAGSDLGLVRTKAMPQPDGSFLLSGTKIFISGGEHDLTDNIVHLVLARLHGPGIEAPPGPKGLSLFLVPKFMPDGTRSPVHCERIEEKMGLHGSPTCVMRFDDATGWIVGEPGRGLSAMFVMMNAARLHVALQGIGLLDAAWQKADAYARERRQMRVPGQRNSAEAADLIAGHPAIRRILDTQRAWIDGGRLLAYKTGIELDIARHHPDAARRGSAQRWCSLVTPVLKAALTSQAFHGASDCLQVFGGHGYVKEWGIEQIVRDSRVTMIYEGTNEVQAIDLLVRKVLPDGGSALAALLDELGDALDAGNAAHAELLSRFAGLRSLASALAQAAPGNPELPYWVADDYLRALALALLAWAWGQIESAMPPLASGEDATRWTAPASALRHWVLPEFDMRMGIIKERLDTT
ncbi:acyl-CoA dehydrogenase family protein [Polaromonas sp. JS666]|uniref:acyl-CoA dehydrogenase family protein n=1 Tax=Polaromonas sp. (strain JS666 / ATCC BAA-500) TaxID=296591 RepID=UPI0000464FBB|nr:acyl-CoA dehydrogenase family protein [Polaromonas sp. JS666]ABE45032.1 acyl-CoA dehydrogenase-like protein [Polaromonas sp. JS666]